MPQSEMITLAHGEGKKKQNKNRAAGQIRRQANGKSPGAPNDQSAPASHHSQVKSSQVSFIYIALLTIQIVSKQLHNIKIGK